MDKNAPTGNVLNDFINGCRKGMQMVLFNVTPNFIMAFALIEILEISGLMGLLTNVLNPVMGLFGLPGKTGICLVSTWLSFPGGIAALSAFIADGSLTGLQVATLVPMMYCISSQLQLTGRILGVTKVANKYYFPTYIIGFICSIAIGFLSRIVGSILF